MEDWQDRPFVILGVNSDKDLAALRPRLLAEQITWRSFWNGPDGTRGPIAKAWNVTGWPTVYVIDHEGVIRHKGHGGPELDAALTKWLEVAEQKSGK
ncbi:MAG: hypothetical protein KDE27_26445 [Planctomycetes bacterium]|nr:hypothetical protein [Planctomycetota bacterium]